ncbi:hypothetical protein ECMP02101712_3865, partial [Escherichia coli MP021017.12]
MYEFLLSGYLCITASQKSRFFRAQMTHVDNE